MATAYTLKCLVRFGQTQPVTSESTMLVVNGKAGFALHDVSDSEEIPEESEEFLHCVSVPGY